MTASRRSALSRLSMPTMITLPGGDFVMGSDAHRPDERPAHRVHLRPFRAAARPVSNADYAAFVDDGGADPPRFWDTPDFALPDRPVVGLSWFEAVAYSAWLAAATGVPFRLPSEAEREFAARGGPTSTDARLHGDGVSAAVVWPWGNDAPAADPNRAALAGLRAPHLPQATCANGYGLRCMADNVHEWCRDWYDPRYYTGSPQRAPGGPSTGQRRTSRGGAWRHAVPFTRIAARSSLDPGYRYNDYGFRLYADAGRTAETAPD